MGDVSRMLFCDSVPSSVSRFRRFLLHLVRHIMTFIIFKCGFVVATTIIIFVHVAHLHVILILELLVGPSILRALQTCRLLSRGFVFLSRILVIVRILCSDQAT